MTSFLPSYKETRTIAETRMDNGCIVKTTSFCKQGVEWFKTTVTHPDTRDVESYMYRDAQEAIFHHRYLADGATYLDGGDTKPYPDRIKQIMWDSEEDK